MHPKIKEFILPGNEPVPASRFFRDRLPDSRSSVASTGVWRPEPLPTTAQPAPQDSDRVLVSVKREPASLTVEGALRKREQRFHCPALGVLLVARV